MIKLIIIAFSLMIFSCGYKIHKLNILVTSNPKGVPIEINGVTIGEAPTRVNMLCNEGKANNDYIVKAFPNSKEKAFEKSKKIDACQFLGLSTGKIHFELNSRESNTITPIEIEKNVNIENKKKEKSVEEKHNLLKKLLEEGTITKEEYKERSLKLLE